MRNVIDVDIIMSLQNDMGYPYLVVSLPDSTFILLSFNITKCFIMSTVTLAVDSGHQISILTDGSRGFPYHIVFNHAHHVDTIVTALSRQNIKI